MSELASEPMDAGPWRTVPTRSRYVAGTVLACAVVFGVVFGPVPLRLGLLLVVLAAAGIAVAFVANRWIYLTLGFVLGALPLVQIPVVSAPLILVLAIAAWGGLMCAERPPVTLGWVEALVALTVLGGAISALATGGGVTAVVEWGRWALAFTLVVVLRVLSSRDLVAFGRAFVAGTVLGGAAGIVLIFIDPQALLLNRLHVVGYSALGGNSRLVLGSQGTSLRLTGTYVDPNLGGFMLVAGLMLALGLLRGAWRVYSVGILAIAVLLTLSRTSIATMVVALVITLLARGVSARTRMFTLSGLALAGLAMLSVASVRYRLADSFGPTDTGTLNRLLALEDFRRLVSGHWLFGLGWARAEFRSGSVAAENNYVANAELFSVYRSGLVVGVPFTAMLIATVLRGWRVVRTTDFPRVAAGAGAMAACLVAAQLDFPIALLPPATMAFGVLVAFATHPDWHRQAG